MSQVGAHTLHLAHRFRNDADRLEQQLDPHAPDGKCSVTTQPAWSTGHEQEPTGHGRRVKLDRQSRYQPRGQRTDGAALSRPIAVS